jgi:hypothetical protein
MGINLSKINEISPLLALKVRNGITADQAQKKTAHSRTGLPQIPPSQAAMIHEWIR